MNKNRILSSAAAFIGLLAAMLACSIGATSEPTAALPTNTPIHTERPTQVPTSTPSPAPTLTPTLAPIGFSVRSGPFEVTVLKARILKSGVHTGDGYYWATKPGYLFIELGAKVSNLDSNARASVPWKSIFIVEDSGEAWYPNWGGYTAVEERNELDPSAIKVSAIPSGDERVDFDMDVFLRLIYVVAEKKPTVVQFGIEESPVIEITVNE